MTKITYNMIIWWENSPRKKIGAVSFTRGWAILFKKKNMDRSIDLAVQHIRYLMIMIIRWLSGISLSGDDYDYQVIIRYIRYLMIRQLLSWTHQMSAGRAWKWKWSYGVEKSETDLFWCISMTNNVKSCKKINRRVQTFRFSVFTMGLCSNRQKNTKTRETKTQITQNFEKVWPI